MCAVSLAASTDALLSLVPDPSSPGSIYIFHLFLIATPLANLVFTERVSLIFHIKSTDSGLCPNPLLCPLHKILYGYNEPQPFCTFFFFLAPISREYTPSAAFPAAMKRRTILCSSSGLFAPVAFMHSLNHSLDHMRKKR